MTLSSAHLFINCNRYLNPYLSLKYANSLNCSDENLGNSSLLASAIEEHIEKILLWDEALNDWTKVNIEENK